MPRATTTMQLERQRLHYEVRLRHNEETIGRLEHEIRQIRSSNAENEALRRDVAVLQAQLQFHERFLTLLETALRTKPCA